jgi:hypothetical protein
MRGFLQTAAREILTRSINTLDYPNSGAPNSSLLFIDVIYSYVPKNSNLSIV